jgi:nitrogen fixation/metabolism regulation signal transduction histidine kinase
LQNLIDKLDLAVAVFDGAGKLSMANPAFGRLQDRPISLLIGASPQELGLAGALKVETESAHWMDFPGRSSRFLVHRTEFRQGGQPRVMVLLSDLKNPLREEERTAWKRLIRVMGHELNNSLTPVISLAESLNARLEKLGMEGEDKTDFAEALSVIESRAVHLNHFMQDYSRLAKLPEPRREAVPVAELAQRVAQLENDARLEVTGGPDCVLNVDPAQVENLLINVLKNALEAAGETGAGKVSFGWRRVATEAILWIDDNGPGLSGTENLFVPFYSTKREGSGIGLVLSREIAEANGGNLTLANRPEGGCRATVVLPLYQNEISAVSE